MTKPMTEKKCEVCHQELCVCDGVTVSDSPMKTTPTESWEDEVKQVLSWYLEKHVNDVLKNLEKLEEEAAEHPENDEKYGFVSMDPVIEVIRSTRQQAYEEGGSDKADDSVEIIKEISQQARREAFLEAAEVAEKDCQCGGYRDTTTTRRHTPECRSEDIAQALEDKALVVTKLQRKSKEILG